MKRKIIAVVLIALMMLGVIGCNKEGLNLYGEISKVSAWESTETTGNMLISAEVQGEKIEFSADFSGYTNTKETQAYIEMNNIGVKVSGVDFAVKISPVKMYIDGQSIYISKTYFTELIGITGAPIPQALSNINAEYIGIDTSTGVDMALVNQESAMQLMDKLFKDSKIKVPVTQKGRTYSIDLDGDQMVDLSVQFIKEVMNNIDAINAFSNTGITQKEVDASKEEIEIALTEGQKMVKPMLEGSRAAIKYVFEDNTYKESIDAAIKLTVEEEKINLNMKVDASYKKSVKKDFKLPESKVLYTMEDLMGLFMSAQMGAVPTGDINIAEISLDDTIAKNKQTYIPLRQTMDQLGIAVGYDAKTKKVTVISDKGPVAVNIMMQQGNSYIALSELRALGFNVLEDEIVIVVLPGTFK